VTDSPGAFKYRLVLKHKKDCMTSGELPYSRATDNHLFNLVKQNDLRAFEELFNRYWPVLVGTAYKKLNSNEKAEDIVQNIFMDIYCRRANIVLTVSLRAYLYQALKYRILNEYRADIRRAKYSETVFLDPDRKIDFSNLLETKDLEIKINCILNKLPEKCRKAFLLSRTENLSNKAISANMQIAVSTVEKHIGKALRTLRTHV
jgi:RNA polymerase sigma-70 factor (family 1)